MSWPSWRFCALCSRWICLRRWICGILQLISLIFLCLVNPLDRSWPSGSNQTFGLPPLQGNIYLVGNFIHVQLLPPCLLCASVWYPTPPKSFTRFSQWTYLPRLWLAAHGLWNPLKSLPHWNDSLPSKPQPTRAECHFWFATGVHPILISLILLAPVAFFLFVSDH